jgi:hypothetical protein
MANSVQTMATNVSPRSGQRAAAVAAAGALLVVIAVAMVLKDAEFGIRSGDPAQPTVTFVAKGDLGAAATTLAPSAAGALIEEAERCRVPLVSITLSRGSAALGATIRIRSGSYVSPYFAITDAAQRIAVPYPAPYGSGAGSFVIEGTATGAMVGLTPAKAMLELPGAETVPVAWHAVSPC